MSFSLLDPQYKWGEATYGTSGGEVTWAVDAGFGNLDYSSAYVLDDFVGALQDAFDEWETVASIDFTYVDASSADITISTDFLAGDTIGLMSWFESGSGFGVQSFDEVWIDFDTSETWAPSDAGATGGTLNFFSVALHEIGHAIGLDHVNDESEIMNSYLTSRDSLGDGDIDGAQYIYDDASSEPDDTVGGDSGGGGGGGAGILGLILGILALLTGMGQFMAVAAFSRGGDDETDEQDEDGNPTGPIAEADSWSEDYNEDPVLLTHHFFKSAGHDECCTCAACALADMEEEAEPESLWI